MCLPHHSLQVRDKAINEWRLYEFDVNLEPPLKKFERNGELLNEI